MKEIRMVDLKTQYDNIKKELQAAIQSVINSTSFVGGPEIEKFEEELADYLGVRNVISCGNGTDALQVALMGLGLKPGDEVITSDFTFIATAEVIAILGLKPVFVDPEPRTFNISAEAVKKAITEKTKAILPVHLFGQCSDMESLIKIARDNKLFLIEDNAQALGANYKFSDGTVKMAGTMGDVGCTSFYPSKNLGCYGDGGAMFTDNDELAKSLKSISNHGQTSKYHHNNIGVNSRLDSVQAAVLRVKLKYFNNYIMARSEAADYYDKELESEKGITIPFRNPSSTHIFHQYTLKINSNARDDLKKYLELNKVPSMIYYPIPLHRQKAYSYLGLRDEDFPVTEMISSEVLSLPMHTELETEQKQYIVDKILKFFEEI